MRKIFLNNTPHTSNSEINKKIFGNSIKASKTTYQPTTIKNNLEDSNIPKNVYDAEKKGIGYTFSNYASDGGAFAGYPFNGRIISHRFSYVSCGGKSYS